MPWEPELPIVTSWDLGIGDTNAIWFAQPAGAAIHVIGYYQNDGEPMSHYISHVLERYAGQVQKPVFSQHIAPPDIAVRDYTVGKPRIEVARQLGINFEVLPQMSADDRIEITRNFLHRCVFDQLACKEGLEGLYNYRRQSNDRTGDGMAKPLHDWASHPADSFGHMAVGLAQRYERKPLSYDNRWVV